MLEAHGLLREGAERDTDGTALLMLGDTALAQEQFDRAAAWYEEAIEIFQTTDYPWGLTDARAGLGGVRFCTGILCRPLRSIATVWRELGIGVSPCS